MGCWPFMGEREEDIRFSRSNGGLRPVDSITEREHNADSFKSARGKISDGAIANRVGDHPLPPTDIRGFASDRWQLSSAHPSQAIGVVDRAIDDFLCQWILIYRATWSSESRKARAWCDPIVLSIVLVGRFF